jgi:hypothetical protein
LREDAGYHWIRLPERPDIASREALDTQAVTTVYDPGFQTAVAGPVW